jgi:hypothetical protein
MASIEEKQIAKEIVLAMIVQNVIDTNGLNNYADAICEDYKKILTTVKGV